MHIGSNQSKHLYVSQTKYIPCVLTCFRTVVSSGVTRIRSLEEIDPGKLEISHLETAF